MTLPTQITRKFACVFLFVLICSAQLFAQQTDLLKATDVIKQNAASIGLSDNDLNNYRIADAYTDKLSGATIYYLQQTYKGIDVLNAIQIVAIQNSQVVSVAGKRIDGMELKANVKNAIAAVTPENAVRAMAKHLNLTVPAFIVALKTMNDKKVVAFGDLGISSVPVRSKLIWVTGNKSNNAILSWQVEVQPKGVADHWLVQVDASKGNVLGKMNLNINCTWGNGENKTLAADDDIVNNASSVSTETFGLNAINSAEYRVIPFPAESPIHTGGTAALVSNPWELAGTGNNATSLKWNDDGTTTYDYTRGNNVLAQEDSNANNGNGKRAISTTAIPDLTFDYPPDYTQQPTITVNRNFAITNLFYWNNIMHDISYQYGFDELSGNFQANNLGRGGTDGDYVLADAQDGRALNNADFSTPDDGSNPRMQMYLWSGSPKIDGDLDNGVVAHEYTHGISTRLTGGPSNSTCLQNVEQMGEGWSDYLALMVTTDWHTATVNDGPNKRPIGNYVIGSSTTGGGIRTYPYSTDMNIDPWTYADMAATGSEVHVIGEIWCTVLWDMTWNIIQMDGINKNIYDANATGGNSAALKLVMEGMKLQSCSPGFIDGRDAILKADTLLYGGKYSCAIWSAFRKRGMGYYALQRSNDIAGDEKADFDSVILVKTANKDSFVQQETITYTFKVNTVPCISLSNYKIVDTLPSNVTYVSSSSGVYNAGNRTVTFSNINLAANSSVTYTIKVTVNNGSYTAPVQHINETFAGNTIPSGWTVYNFKSNPWTVSTAESHSAPYALFAADISSTSLTRFSTSTAFPLTNNSTLTFWHYYNTESGWDGGRVEISTNNGVTYSDLSKYMIQNGYQNSIYDSIIKTFRPAFSGNSNGFIRTVINLTSFAGKSAKFRFVFTSDEAVGVEGWYIDDITLTSESGIQNLGQFFNSNNLLATSSTAYSTIKEGTLPLTWGEFTAVKNGNTSLLKWQTLQEYNTANFIIERSTDGVNFHQLATVAAAGSSSIARTYQLTDQLPLNGKDFYRIKQVDKDGKFTYSPVRSLEFLLNQIINITPNPAHDKIAVTISGNDKALKVSIIDATGKQVKSFNMQGQYLQLSLPGIAPGIYYIRIAGDGINSTHKLIVQ
ncbi:M36 family metallopeptidase [Panacibacter ginsenosidivorans]|nr:M36 family metallopeptidase [Panacibacter ginsenosidivorans]